MALEYNVQQIQCIDEKGYWTRRSVFLNMDDTFIYGLKKVVNDKNIVDSYSTVRSVLYA